MDFKDEPTWHDQDEFLQAFPSYLEKIVKRHQFLVDELNQIQTSLTANIHSSKGQDTKLVDADGKKGNAEYSVDGGYSWADGYAVLDGDTLNLWAVAPQNLDTSPPDFSYQIIWSKNYKTHLLTQKSRLNMFEVVEITRAWSSNGYVDIMDSDKSWQNTFVTLFSSMYSKDEIDQNKSLCQTVRKVIKSEKYLCTKYFGFALLLRMRATGAKCLLRGPLEVVRSRKKLKEKPFQQVFGELYDGFLLLYKYEDSDMSYTSMPLLRAHAAGRKKVYVYIIIMRFAALERHKKHTIFIRTPTKTYALKYRHSELKEQWLKYLKAGCEDRHGHIKYKSLDHDTQSVKYSYSKPLKDRMKLVETTHPKAKRHALKFPSSTIGRSRTNIVCVPDTSLSRFHGKIDVIDNVPYLIDVGSSSGVKLNGERVVNEPLAPNDEIRVGNAVFTFLVKDGDTIFHKDQVGDSMDSIDPTLSKVEDSELLTLLE